MKSIGLSVNNFQNRISSIYQLQKNIE